MLIFQKMITRADLRANPTVLYIFGDNAARTGYGGQAAQMRGEPNAVGIATKWNPGRTSADYFSDADFDRIMPIFDADFARPLAYLRQGGVVVMPFMSIGTGLADLEERAPLVYRNLNKRIREMREIGKQPELDD